MHTSRQVNQSADLQSSTVLWEAAFDANKNDDDTEEADLSDEEMREAHGPSLEHSIIVARGGKLCIRVRDDSWILPGTVFVSHFDSVSSQGGKGPIEESGLVGVGDFLVRVNGCDVVGKGARHALALIKDEASADSVSLTFRRLQTSSISREGNRIRSEAGIHLTEQHRVLMFRYLLDSNPIDKRRLASLAGDGIPDVDKHLRPLAWRILLLYLPDEVSLWDAHLKQERAIYYQLVQELTIMTGPAASCPPSASGHVINESEDQNFGGSWRAGDASPRLDTPLCALSSAPSQEGDARNTASSMKAIDPNLNFCQGHPGSAPPLPRSGRGSGELDVSLGSSQDRLPTRPRFDADRSLFNEIRKDVVRTHPDQNFYQDQTFGTARYDALLRILFIYAKTNSGTRYIQGMNELAGTLFYVMSRDSDQEWAEHAEADTMFLFAQLMSQLRDVFIEKMDESDTGIESKFEQLEVLLERHDPTLSKHFRMIGLEAHFYSLRWITTLFCREFTLPDTIAVWDALFADKDFSDFILYFCLSMLMEQRQEMLRCSFAKCLQSLQAYSPEAEMKRLLHRMRSLRAQDSASGFRVDRRVGEAATPSTSRVRNYFSRVSSRMRDDVPIALGSFSTESKSHFKRAGAQLKASFGSMRKLIGDSMSVLPSPGATGGAPSTT